MGISHTFAGGVAPTSALAVALHCSSVFRAATFRILSRSTSVTGKVFLLSYSVQVLHWYSLGGVFSSAVKSCFQPGF